MQLSKLCIYKLFVFFKTTLQKFTKILHNDNFQHNVSQLPGGLGMVLRTRKCLGFSIWECKTIASSVRLAEVFNLRTYKIK